MLTTIPEGLPATDPMSFRGRLHLGIVVIILVCLLGVILLSALGRPTPDLLDRSATLGIGYLIATLSVNASAGRIAPTKEPPV